MICSKFTVKVNLSIWSVMTERYAYQIKMSKDKSLKYPFLPSYVYETYFKSKIFFDFIKYTNVRLDFTFLCLLSLTMSSNKCKENDKVL